MYDSLPINTIPLANVVNYTYTLFIALFYNIMHIVYPVNLSVDYTLIFSKYTFILIAFLLLIIFLSIVYVNDKFVKFSILSLIIAYLPISNIIPLINTIADRYLYYPMIFVSILFGLLFLKLQKFVNTKLLITFVILLFAINTAISYDRGNVYNNQYSLYYDAIIKNPNHPRILYNMAIAYYDNKEYEKSLELLNKLSSIKPSYKREIVWFIMGKNYEQLKDKETAKKYYMKAFLLSPKNQELLDKFVSMFPSVDNSLYYLLNNTNSLDDEVFITFQEYQKSKNTVEIK
jgi:tetratricopeptide (TPR) repeat protein